MTSSPSHRNPGSNEVAPVPNVVPVAQMRGEDDEDTTFLRKMLEGATSYIQSFSWCGSIHSTYFAGGVGKIFAVFLFNITPTRPEVDAWIWIVVGDIPPAYLPLEDCKSGLEVFDTYISGMKRWVVIAREGRESTPDDDVPPVNVPATPEWADKMDSRLRILGESVRPFFE